MKLNIGNAAVLMIALAASVARPGTASAQAPNLAGQWVLNREASQFPPGIGFTPDWFTNAGGGTPAPSGGGRGGRRGGSAGGSRGYIPSFESEEDTKRVRQLTADARNPSVHLTIAETANATTITDDSGEALTFYADARHQELQLGGLSVGATARRVSGHLEVVYEVERDRTLRYTYSRSTPNRITVDVEFVEHGKAGDHATRVYDTASGDATTTTSSNGAKPDAAAAAAPSKSGGASEPAEHASSGTFAQEPGAELKGVKRVGLVVDASGPQAVACGLNQGALETALSKRLTDAGLNVRLNADEDTYVYINVMTSHAPSDLCVSRYDVFLYTHTTASLSYHTTPVLVQVSLLHQGGLAGGPSATHPDAVQRGLEQYVDLFLTRISDANKP
ncbi:MAG TPA: hypothetical protein VF456_04340 [Vicinamibacterales bacterium]